MLPRSREWKHYFSLRHLNINLCDLFISPDVPVQSRLHQLPNRASALFSPRRSSGELCFSHFWKKRTDKEKNKRGWRYHAWLLFLQRRQKKKSFLLILKSERLLPLLLLLRVEPNRCFSSAKLPLLVSVALRRYSAPPPPREVSIISSQKKKKKSSFWLTSVHQTFILRPSLHVLNFHLSYDSRHACRSYTGVDGCITDLQLIYKEDKKV